MGYVGPGYVRPGYVRLGHVRLALSLLGGLASISGRAGKLNRIIGAIFIKCCRRPDYNAAGAGIGQMSRAVILAVSRWPPDMLVGASSDVVSLEYG